MSLSYASDTSMVKIMKCLDNKSDRNTLRNLMKCSYKVNKVADENGFSKIPEAAVIIYLFPSYVHCNLHSFNGVCWQLWNTNIQAKMGSIYFAKPRNHIKRMEKALLYVQSKVKSIKRLTVHSLPMDADMLEVFKKNANFIRTITEIKLWRIRIKWTTDQFLQFMKIFDHLETFVIYDNLKEPVKYTVTNEILSLVKTSVVIYRPSFLWLDGRIKFPLISSSIFDFWLKEKTLKFLRFGGISTEISFLSARRMIEHFIVNNNPEHVEYMHFGILKYSSDFHLELALFQKERGFKFYISRAKRLCEVVITYVNSKAKFSFEVECPVELSFFETMLDDLQRLRLACEPHQNAAWRIRRPFNEMFQKHVNNLQLHYYRFTKGITGTATVRGFENEMMQEMNTLEEEIQVIIEKLKAEGMESVNLPQH